MGVMVRLLVATHPTRSAIALTAARVGDALKTLTDEPDLAGAILNPNLEENLKTLREEAVRNIFDEARQKNIFIHADDEAEAYLNFRARQQGVPPETLGAATLGDDIFIRARLAVNPRVLREEMIHVEQQRAGIGSDATVQGEISARLEIIRNYGNWGISNKEIWEMLADIGQIRRTGRY
jgi:hypothetical protein